MLDTSILQIEYDANEIGARDLVRYEDTDIFDMYFKITFSNFKFI